MKRVFKWGDLFCGCGGMATGGVRALEARQIAHEGWAINHWQCAVQTMQTNHPHVHVMEMDLTTVIPSEVIPCRHLDHLHASPSCTHHSRAKGGRPRSNQLRAQPNLVLDWLDDIDVSFLSIENVPEFRDWGPLDYYGRPIERLKGSNFKAWVRSIEARNYIVEWQVVNCADYGDATSRQRFFLKAVKRGRGKIHWPRPTHAEHPTTDLWGFTPQPWRGVRECLDLDDTGTSIFNRSRPLAANTLRRIAVGAQKYWGINLEPFILRLRKNQDVASIDEPISAIACSGGHHALCTPIILDHFKGGEIQDGSRPIGAQTTHDRFSVVQPLVMDMSHPGDTNDLGRILPDSAPMKTLTTRNNSALIQPLVLGQHGGATARPINEPCPTIATSGAIRVATPVILDMSRPGGNDSGHIRSANQPLQTLTTCDAVQGCFPVLADGRIVDIRIRMLKPSELAAAHSFPDGYVITGNRGEQVKQIGNSVPVRTAEAMMAADLEAVAA